MQNLQSQLEMIRSEVKRPEDFDSYWEEIRAEVMGVPLRFDRYTDEALFAPKYRVNVLRFQSIEGITVYGWLAVPSSVASGARVNGYLWLPGYSRGNPPPGPESLYPDTVTFGLNVHGNPPTTPYIHPSQNGDDYITDGIADPKTYVFRRIAAHCLMALRVLAAQPEVDPDRIVVGGMSQGGGLALIAAAQSTIPRLCFADMPWMSDLDQALTLVDLDRYRALWKYGADGEGAPVVQGSLTRRGRLPDSRLLVAFYAEDHPLITDQVYRTFRYFDTLSHGALVRCPVQMSAGRRDPSCKPATIYAVYNEIPGDKEMLYLPTAGHEIVPEMHDAHLIWLRSKLQ
ncbi:MAG: acetylxylan esterase [Capsulimonadaceae bacterium]